MSRRDRYRRSHRKSHDRRRGRKPHKKNQFIKKEREVAILDVLLHGHLDESKPSWAKKSIAQVLTFEDFVLYEVEIPDKKSDIQVQEKQTFEKFRKEQKLGKVLKKIDYDDLTSTSKALIEPILEEKVEELEGKFINFYNKSTSITPRMHALKLLPGIGNKHMWEIIEARKKQNFTTFQDIIDRTSISNPKKPIVQRIIKELQRDAKYYLFSKTKKYE
ncbi:MAG: DUF655 domain-containing protein [Promethearchaeia archaeon]